MKHFTGTDFSKKEDIQVQVNVARLGIVVELNEGVNLEDVFLRTRLVGVGGTKNNIQKTSLRTLFEQAPFTEGFYTIADKEAGRRAYAGHVDISRSGALRLDNRRYLSCDIECADGKTIGHAELHSIQHPALTDSYLHYSPVTITQAIQGISVENGVELVVPLLKVEAVTMQYPGNNIVYGRSDLFSIACMKNDIVSVNTTTGTIKAGYDELITVELEDTVSRTRATRVEVEAAANAGTFNTLLIEEKTLPSAE